MEKVASKPPMLTKRQVPEGVYKAVLTKVVDFDGEYLAEYPYMPDMRCVFTVASGEFERCRVNLNFKLDHSRFTDGQVQNSNRLLEDMGNVTGADRVNECVGQEFEIVVSEFATDDKTCTYVSGISCGHEDTEGDFVDE